MGGVECGGVECGVDRGAKIEWEGGFYSLKWAISMPVTRQMLSSVTMYIVTVYIGIHN